VSYCSNCGKALEEGAKFCSGCGTTVSGAQLAAPTPVTRFATVNPKSGGSLAFKGFLTALLLALIFAAATKSDKSDVGIVTAFGIGAAYIIITLRKWKQSKSPVHGLVIGWTVAVFLLLACFIGLMGVGIRAISDGTSTASTPTAIPGIDSTSSGTPTSAEPKDVLLRDVKLNFKWHTDGFGNVMIADFTVKNPTRYRFKDFEIKCTHSAPSGTVIDSNTQTIYQTVEPKSTKVIKEMNMGFINSQATRSGCEITDLAVIQ
jgi:hypothetical protein